MKIVKNAILSLVVALGAMSFANAQMMRAGVNVTPSLPLGDFADEEGYAAGFGIGGSLFGNYYFNENVHAGLEVAYRLYSVDVEGVDDSYTFLPIQATAAYHTDAEAELDFYVGTGLGLFVVSSTVEGAESESYFGFTPRAGVSYEISDAMRLHGGLSFGYVMTPTEEVDVPEIDPNTGFPTGNLVTEEVDVPDISFLNINLGVSFLLFD